ncbi:MAG: hypothetical protein AAF716_03925 [Cyanobacteria bacterium P01_D01_bin.1]
MSAHTQKLFTVNNSPFHDPQQNPLPDANDIEQKAANDMEPNPFQAESPRSPSPHLKQDIQTMRKLIIGLLVTGLALGCVVGAGVIFFMRRTGLADPPNSNQGQVYERPNVAILGDANN